MVVRSSTIAGSCADAEGRLHPAAVAVAFTVPSPGFGIREYQYGSWAPEGSRYVWLVVESSLLIVSSASGPESVGLVPDRGVSAAK